ncbi:hypothetical protein QBC39DRAFT_265866, partial [Podospora conica]
TVRPRYAELPTLAGGERHAWDLYGRDDELGTLNELTPPAVQAAATHVVSGERVDIQLPFNLPDPPLFGRWPLRRETLQTDRNMWDDRVDRFIPGASTQ